MKRNWVSIALIALLVIGAAAAVGVYEYRAGVAQGLTMGGRVSEGPAAWPYPYWYGHFHPFGFVFPLLLVFLIFALARRIFWWRRWQGSDQWRRDREARLDEWHRRAHESMASPPSR